MSIGKGWGDCLVLSYNYMGKGGCPVLRIRRGGGGAGGGGGGGYLVFSVGKGGCPCFVYQEGRLNAFRANEVRTGISGYYVTSLLFLLVNNNNNNK